MTPYCNPTTPTECNYNQLLKKERKIIERCFGQLKRRFPILQYVCRVKLDNVVKILGDTEFEPAEEIEHVQDDVEDANIHEEVPLRQQGEEIRNNLSIVIQNLIT